MKKPVHSACWEHKLFLAGWEPESQKCLFPCIQWCPCVHDLMSTLPPLASVILSSARSSKETQTSLVPRCLPVSAPGDHRSLSHLFLEQSQGVRIWFPSSRDQSLCCLTSASENQYFTYSFLSFSCLWWKSKSGQSYFNFAWPCMVFRVCF